MVGVLISSLGIFSGCRRHSHAHKAEFMVDYISETLDLAESQKEQLDEIKDELMAVKEQFSDERRTEILESHLDLSTSPQILLISL